MKSNDLERDILASGGTREAMSWLTEPRVPERSLGESSSREASIALVQELYDVGAVNVWVFDIDGGANEEQNSGRLIAELPNDRDRRAKVFAKCVEIAKYQGFDAELDTGQQYILIMLD